VLSLDSILLPFAVRKFNFEVAFHGEKIVKTHSYVCTRIPADGFNINQSNCFRYSAATVLESRRRELLAIECLNAFFKHFSSVSNFLQPSRFMLNHSSPALAEECLTMSRTINLDNESRQ
jgi:hypothetical protein